MTWADDLVVEYPDNFDRDAMENLVRHETTGAGESFDFEWFSWHYKILHIDKVYYFFRRYGDGFGRWEFIPNVVGHKKLEAAL